MKLNNELILSRPIIHRRITWFHVVLLSLVYCSVDAQKHSPGSEDKYGLYSNFDPTIAIVIVVLICAFFFAGMLSIFIRQCSENTIPNLPAATFAGNRLWRQAGIDHALIEQFPVFLYSEVKDIKIGRETLECAVCLSEFEDDETLRLLPKCNHVFHQECIDEWLAFHITCPVCRAKLTPESVEIPKISPEQPTTTEPNQQSSAANNLTQAQNEIAIAVNELEQNRESQLPRATKNRPRRSGISNKFPRSHSTGHSLVQAGENIERYTLRLPEEFRNQIMENAKLKRAMSFDVILAGEGSSRKGHRSGAGSEDGSRGKHLGRSDRWAFMMNPNFVPRGGSVKSSKSIDNEGSGDSVNGRNLLASVKKAPLNCLNIKVEGVGESTRNRPAV